MRVFFGISLPSSVRRAVKEYTDLIKDKLPRVKWVEMQNLHITLRFLGEVDESRIPNVSLAAREVSESIGNFSIVMGPLGAFSNPRKARVVWWGLDKGASECALLAKNLEQSLVNAGFEAEPKRYHPHITLARLRNPTSLTLDSMKPPSGLSFTAESFTLFQSTLTPRGPTYKIIEEFSLGC